MSMIGFQYLFPEEAADECRTLVPLGRADLPNRTFVLHDRLVRHYTMWKTVVDDPSHPAQEKVRAVQDGDAAFPPEPVRRAGPKIGPNDPCPCGSGRKYRKRCRR